MKFKSPVLKVVQYDYVTLIDTNDIAAVNVDYVKSYNYDSKETTLDIVHVYIHYKAGKTHHCQFAYTNQEKGIKLYERLLEIITSGSTLEVIK